ncbi:MAG: tripartite tricarboxylate transporter substrate binding protein [Hyphomicrobiaceae bacterium]|nr:MAG: tripartite tricarboxylate transporter substrate binding protein [Hyphomicrobiaceae bacterium]
MQSKHTTHRRDILRGGAALAATTLLPSLLAAQTTSWPKQIKIVVPFPPGGSNDIFARLIAQKLGPGLGATIVVENKGGAGGTIGASQVARSNPDGATLLLTSSTFTGSAAVMNQLPYDAVKSFTPIAMLARGPMLIATGNGTPYNSLPDLISAAKKDPGKLAYGTAGVGSINHLATELLATSAKVEMTHVPYKGIAGAVTDMIGGRLDLAILSFPSAIGHVRGGKIRALAVTSKDASPFAKDLAPVAATVAGYEVDLWWGLFAPAGVAQAMTEQLNTLLKSIITDAVMTERFAREGAVPAPISSAEFATIVAADLERWRRIAKERGIKAE